MARRSRGKLVAVVFFKHTPDAHEDRGTLGDGITPMSNNNEPLTGAKYLEQWREPVSCKIHPEHPAMSFISHYFFNFTDSKILVSNPF